MPASNTSFFDKRPDAARPDTVSVVTSAPPNAAAVSIDTPSTPLPTSKARARSAPKVAPAVVPTVLGVASALLKIA
jgi:hypothetical protein